MKILPHLILLLSLPTFAQLPAAAQCPTSVSLEFWGLSKLQNPSEDAVKVLSWITDMIGIRPNFRFCRAAFKKKNIAIAGRYKGHRYIVYDTEVVFVDSKGVIRYDDLSVLAHEIGHHIAGHTVLNNLSSYAEELEADRFAGFVLGRIGADFTQAMKWTLILNEFDTKSHPAREKRQKASEEGWQLANRMKARETQTGCKNHWIGDIFESDDELCRIGWRCHLTPPSVQWACLDETGQWRWRTTSVSLFSGITRF